MSCVELRVYAFAMAKCTFESIAESIFMIPLAQPGTETTADHTLPS